MNKNKNKTNYTPFFKSKLRNVIVSRCSSLFFDSTSLSKFSHVIDILSFVPKSDSSECYCSSDCFHTNSSFLISENKNNKLFELSRATKFLRQARIRNGYILILDNSPSSVLSKAMINVLDHTLSDPLSQELSRYMAHAPPLPIGNID